MKYLFLITSVLLLGLVPQAPICKCNNGMLAGTDGAWTGTVIEAGSGKCIRTRLHCGWHCGTPLTQTQYLPDGYCKKGVEPPNLTPNLDRLIFNIPGTGTIYLDLPGDVAPGDVVTGTVFVEPNAGEEREKNLSSLQKFVVDIGGRKKIFTSERTFKLVLPPALELAPVTVKLLDSKGKLVDRGELLLLAPRPPQPPDVSLPNHGQVGRFVTVVCACDGVLTDKDYVKVSGSEVLPIAESARQRTFLNTSEAAGLTQIEISEQGRVSKGEFRNISLKMTASKLSLLKGEQATMLVEVHGLTNLKNETLVSLENHSTSILTMSGGDKQTITIRPSDVKAGGVYTTERTLTGITAGPFSIDGVVSINPD